MPNKNKMEGKQGLIPGTPNKKAVVKDESGAVIKGEISKLAKNSLDKWEIMKGKKADYTEANKKLMVAMKNAGRSYVTAIDSDNVKRKLNYNESEGISITKASPEE